MRNYNIKDYRTERWDGFKDYYVKMMLSGDCDPSYPALNYIADRYEINMEQRYWLAYLYGLSYCVPTAFYFFNEFPDYENVDVNRLTRWWNKNKNKTYFQTDRKRVKNYEGVVVKSFESYRDLIGDSQVEKFNEFKSIKNLQERYNKVYKFTDKIYYFGRFSLFNYLETINEITDLKLEPNALNFKKAESSRNGMCYCCEKDNFITLHHKKPKEQIDYDFLQEKLDLVKHELKQENPEIDVNYWNIETVLCAYKKLFWNTRYLGYYIDRQMKEIYILQENVYEGVEWQVLWDFRKEFFHPYFLGELNNWNDIREENLYYVTENGKLDINPFPEYYIYRRKVDFDSIGDIYNVSNGNNKLACAQSNLEYYNKKYTKKQHKFKSIWDYV